jgi:thiol-disulfide isomerase/thioredoxin
MKTIFIVLFINIAAYTSLTAQTQAVRSKFQIGDPLPPIILKNLINYPSATENLSAFKGKTVILYFWNEGCTSSIEEWPKLIRLQHQFEKYMQILLVNESQDKPAVQKILEDQKRVAHVNMKLPIVCLDEGLNRLFPRSSVPHLVWIDGSGKLMAVTSGDQLNETNLRALAEGTKIAMLQKEGIKYRVDFSKPLFVKSNGGDGDHLQWQSVLSEYFPGLAAESWIDSTGGTLSNTTMITMFRYLFKGETNRFGALNLFPESKVVLKALDTTKYMVRVNGELRRENFYTYQLYSKQPRAPQMIRSVMLSDIKRYFGVDCYWAKKRKLCLVLSARDSAKFAYRSGDTMLAIRPTDIHLNNVTFKEFLENLLAVTDYHHSPFPFVDETGFKGKVGDIKFEANVNDPKDLDRALSKYGISLKLEPREVDVLVIYETDDYIRPVNIGVAN